MTSTSTTSNTSNTMSEQQLIDEVKTAGERKRTSIALAAALVASGDELPSTAVDPNEKNKRGRRVSIPAQAGKIDLGTGEEFSEMTSGDRLKIARRIEDTLVREFQAHDDEKPFELGDVLDNLNSGVDVIVEDDFSLCFQRKELRPWNWNFYLLLFWCIGVVIRYGILLPVRVLIMLLGMILECFLLWLFQHIFKDKDDVKEAWELWSLQLLTKIWIFAWTGVIEYKGVIPKKRPNQIYVANHSTMLDWLLLMQMHPFCVVGQLHSSKPFIGWVQQELLKSLNCIWFNREEQADRDKATQRIQDHIKDANKPRLLIFPEGTCVNNEYVIQFKKGAFAMGAEICPIAIKYNKTFVDAYWISRERPFHWHLFDIITSWAMVAEVHYLEPQHIRPNETPEEFADRVKILIAKAGGLIPVDWNGYLKHYRPSERLINARKEMIAKRLLRNIEIKK